MLRALIWAFGNKERRELADTAVSERSKKCEFRGSLPCTKRSSAGEAGACCCNPQCRYLLFVRWLDVRFSEEDSCPHGSPETLERDVSNVISTNKVKNVPRRLASCLALPQQCTPRLYSTSSLLCLSLTQSFPAWQQASVPASGVGQAMHSSFPTATPRRGRRSLQESEPELIWQDFREVFSASGGGHASQCQASNELSIERRS